MSLHLYLTGQTPETRVGGKHFLLAIQFLQFLRSLPEFQVFHDYTVYVQDSDPSVTRKLHAKIEQALGGGKTHIKAKKKEKKRLPSPGNGKPTIDEPDDLPPPPPPTQKPGRKKKKSSKEKKEDKSQDFSKLVDADLPPPPSTEKNFSK